jgi:hypothetical protein
VRTAATILGTVAELSATVLFLAVLVFIAGILVGVIA